MNKKSLILNVTLLVLEIIGFSLSIISKRSFISFKFYTNLSNFLALLSSIFVLISYKLDNKVISNITNYLKFISTIGLTITLIVVITVLGPDGYKKDGIDGYLAYIFPNGLLCLHVLCPIVSIINFVFIEDNNKYYSYKWFLLSTLYTFLYGIIVITIVYYSNVKPPYFFLNSKSIGYWKTFGFGLIFVFASFLVSYLLIVINKVIKRKTQH